MIIAVGHEPNSGKDTFVMFIIDYLRQKFKNLDLPREGFADRVYNLCYELYSWAGFQTKQYYLTHPKEKEIILPKVGWTPRQLLIGIAEKVREFDPKAWLNPVYYNKPKHLKFITDFRTWEEYEAGKALGVYMVRVDRDDRPKIDCKISAEFRGRDDIWDEIIKNNGTLSEFREIAVEFANRKLVPHIQKVLCGEIVV